MGLCKYNIDVKISRAELSYCPISACAASQHTLLLTEVEDHAREHNESKPDAEVRDEVDDGDDDVTDGGKDAEQDVAARQRRLLSQVT